MANEELKRLFRSEGVYMWEVAQALGVHEITLSRRFRTELTQGQKDGVLAAFERVKADRARGTGCTKRKAAPGVITAACSPGGWQRDIPDDAVY